MRTPLRFRKARMKDLDSETLRPVLHYWEHRFSHFQNGVGLMLCGPPGVGKTYACAAMTNELTRIDSEFATASEVLRKYESIEPVWDDYRNQPYDTTLEEVDWLVINDLGKEYRGGKLEEQMTCRFGSLLRRRSEECKVTHITTNLFPASRIRETYGDSVASLLMEMCVIVEVSGPDRRVDGC